VAVLLIGVVGLVPIFFLSGRFADTVEGVVQGPAESITIEELSFSTSVPVPTVEPTPGFISEVLVFGGEGTGPGLLDDSRRVAVDAEGRIYTADYDTGRVQVFDAEGEYLDHWIIPDEPIISDLDADRQGNLYVVSQTHVLRFDGATREQTGELVVDGWGSYDSVSVAPDGSIYASSTPAGDTAIIIFNPDGSVKQIIPDPIEGITGDSELDTNVAVDGLGNLYVLGGFNGAVFAYDASGQYQSRFGSEGTEEGQFRSLQDIEVDGQGRIWVADAMGLFVFAPDGRLLDILDVEGVPFGLDFDSDGFLYVSNRDTITKYQVNE
jgi:sugar lactone lactonase YvrE